MPLSQRPTTKAVLTSWAEVDRTGHLSGPGLVDYRPVWLVYSTTGAPNQFDWKVIDADTGSVLQSDKAASAPWITSVSDRSTGGCEPPLGALTRSEISQYELPGATFVLTTLADAYAATQATHGGSISRTLCAGECDPLVWMAVLPGGQQADILDAVTGGNLGGSSPPPAVLPDDLDPS